MNDSSRVSLSNPWNEFLNQFYENNLNISINSTNKCTEKHFLKHLASKSLRPHTILLCRLCENIIVNRNFVGHFESRHSEDTPNNLIGDVFFKLNANKENRIRRNKKRFQLKNVTSKDKYVDFEIKKERNQNGKYTKNSKRSYSMSVFRDDAVDDIKKSYKKRKNSYVHIEEYCTTDNEADNINLESCGTETKSIADLLNNSDDLVNINDSLYTQVDSFNNRVSSDSSTPPSLSLGGGGSTVNTLSSPGSSLHHINSNIEISEHYNLSMCSSDITFDRSNSCNKYQIDSLPWENIPSLQSIPDEPNKFKQESNKLFESEDCGEIERAVQSITGCFGNGVFSDKNISNENLQHFMTLNESVLKNVDIKLKEKSKHLGVETSSPSIYSSISLIEETEKNQKSSINFSDLNESIDDDNSIIESFLDELTQQCSNVNGSENSIQDSNSYADSISFQSQSPYIKNTNSKVSNNQNDQLDNQNESGKTLVNNLSDYDEKFEALINSALCDFVTHSPNSVQAQHLCTNYKRNFNKSSAKFFDPMKHCGVKELNGDICFRGLMCKHHTMPQKRLVDRPESITVLIKAKKIKRKQMCNEICSDSVLIDSKNKFITSSLSVIQNSVNMKKVKDAFKPITEPLLNGEIRIQNGKSYITSKHLVWKSVLESSYKVSQLSDSSSIPGRLSNKIFVDEFKISNDFYNFENNSISNVTYNEESKNLAMLKPESNESSKYSCNDLKYLCSDSSEDRRNSMLVLNNRTESDSCNSNNIQCINNDSKNSSKELFSNISTSTAAFYYQSPSSNLGANTSPFHTLSLTPNTGSNNQSQTISGTHQLFYPIRTGTVSNASGGRILMLMNSLPTHANSTTNIGPNTIPVSQITQSIDQNNHTSNAVSSKLNSENASPKSVSSTNALPLTVHSSTPNGLTQRFVILPDGTISAAAAAAIAANQQNNYQTRQQIFAGVRQPNKISQINQNEKLIITTPSVVNSNSLSSIPHHPHFLMPSSQHILSASPQDGISLCPQNNQNNQSQQKIAFQFPTATFMSPHSATGSFLITSNPSTQHLSFRQPSLNTCITSSITNNSNALFLPSTNNGVNTNTIIRSTNASNNSSNQKALNTLESNTTSIDVGFQSNTFLKENQCHLKQNSLVTKDININSASIFHPIQPPVTISDSIDNIQSNTMQKQTNCNPMILNQNKKINNNNSSTTIDNQCISNSNSGNISTVATTVGYYKPSSYDNLNSLNKSNCPTPALVISPQFIQQSQFNYQNNQIISHMNQHVNNTFNTKNINTNIRLVNQNSTIPTHNFKTSIQNNTINSNKNSTNEPQFIQKNVHIDDSKVNSNDYVVMQSVIT